MVVVGTGRLITDTAPIMLQPMDLAMIRELRVKAGDTVTKGEVLATLDPTFARADLLSLSSQQGSLVAQKRRLEAELNDQPFEMPVVAGSDDQLQQTLYNQRHAQYDSQLRVYDEDIQLRRASLRTTQDDLASTAKQLEVAKDVESMRTTLMQSQIGSKLQFLEAKSNRMHIEQEQQDAANRLTELQHELQSKEAERQAFIDQWRHQILESLVDTRTQLSKVDEGQTKASRMNDLVVVTAPADGVVLDVANRSPGSVLRQAEPLVTMGPVQCQACRRNLDRFGRRRLHHPRGTRWWLRSMPSLISATACCRVNCYRSARSLFPAAGAAPIPAFRWSTAMEALFIAAEWNC